MCKPSKQRLGNLSYHSSQREYWAEYFRRIGKSGEAKIHEKKAQQLKKGLKTESSKPGWTEQRYKKRRN